VSNSGKVVRGRYSPRPSVASPPTSARGAKSPTLPFTVDQANKALTQVRDKEVMG
jgi:hypothetical protein